MNKTLISICCATFNHEEYIEKTIKGFLMQEGDFECEILIHDDASTDKTAEIIRKYEKMFPNKIFPIYQTENQFSQGKKYSELNYERVKGKYVAICEGDDCWLDKTKLAKQISLMEKNPEFGLCFHSAVRQNLSNNSVDIIGRYLYEDGIVPVGEVITKEFGMIPTASMLMTKKTLEKVLNFRKDNPYLTIGDLYFQIFGSLDSGLLFINNPMSLYRLYTSYSWTLEWKNSIEKKYIHLEAVAKSYIELNRLTDFKYKQFFEISIIKRLFAVVSHLVLNLEDEYKLNIESLPFLIRLYLEEFLNLIEQLKYTNEKYILYGAGTTSKLILELLDDKIDFIVDKDMEKHETIYCNKKVFYLDYLDKNSKQKIIISLLGRSKNIIKNLEIDKTRFIYFDDELISKYFLTTIKL